MFHDFPQQLALCVLMRIRQQCGEVYNLGVPLIAMVDGSNTLEGYITYPIPGSANSLITSFNYE